MNFRTANSQRGFTLIELLVAAALGVVVILSATSLFKAAMDTTFVITQRAETQQNMRAAIELMSKDLSQAGAGLPTGGLQLVSASGTASQFGCALTTGLCYVPNNSYPNNGASTNYMYPIIPNFSNGVEGGLTIPGATSLVNDSITVAYCDYNFPLTNFSFSFSSNNTAVATLLNAANQPNNIESPGGLNSNGGDLLLFVASSSPSANAGSGSQGNSSVQSAQAVGEITTITGSSPSWNINMAAGDLLRFNQNGTTAGSPWVGSLGSVANAMANPGVGNVSTASVCRLNVVTYFLQVPAAGSTVQVPRLMRQVDGFAPVPVADNIINLQFAYDVINTAVQPNVIDANQNNPIGAGLSPALIQKINMFVMGQSLVKGTKKSQSMYLASSVSTRNTSFCNVYSSSGTQCQ